MTRRPVLLPTQQGLSPWDKPSCSQLLAIRLLAIRRPILPLFLWRLVLIQPHLIQRRNIRPRNIRLDKLGIRPLPHPLRLIRAASIRIRMPASSLRLLSTQQLPNTRLPLNTRLLNSILVRSMRIPSMARRSTVHLLTLARRLSTLAHSQSPLNLLPRRPHPIRQQSR
jgi:hypothetical protein